MTSLSQRYMGHIPKIPVSVRVRDQKQISRDCALASELVQADYMRFQIRVGFYPVILSGQHFRYNDL